MPGKKAELQVPLEEIIDDKDGKHGKIFLIKIAYYKPKWVPETKLSQGAANSYLNGDPLPKKAHVVLPRRYNEPPGKTKVKTISSFFGKRTIPDDTTDAPAKKKSRSDGNTTKIKKKKKKRVMTKLLMESWCGQSRGYIKKFNSILDVKDKSELLKMINEAAVVLKPNQESAHLFSSEKFLTGSIIKHKKENIHCLRVTETPGTIRCDVCEEIFKASRVCRVINHCFHKTHVIKLKRKQDDISQQKGNLETFTKEGHNETTIVSRVQNFVAQQIALKGLPFTAGVHY